MTVILTVRVYVSAYEHLEYRRSHTRQHEISQIEHKRQVLRLNTVERSSLIAVLTQWIRLNSMTRYHIFNDESHYEYATDEKRYECRPQ